MAPISTMIRDPFVRLAFERAERDAGQAPAEVAPRPVTLDGGAAEHQSAEAQS